MRLNEAERRARKKLCVALDMDPYEAADLAKMLSDIVGYFKLNFSLVKASNTGFPLVARVWDADPDKEANAFVDLKPNDIPRTVYEVSRNFANAGGVYMMSVHLSGCEAMCKEALRGAEDGTVKQRIGDHGIYVDTRPKVVGVTVLSHLTDADLEADGSSMGYRDLVRRRTENSRRWGLDGVVCRASMAGSLEKEFGSDFIYVAVEHEWKGIHGKGQVEPYSPARTVRECKNVMVISGSAIINSTNRRETAYEMLKAMAAEL